MDVKKAEEYIRIMLKNLTIPDGVKAIYYVYAKEAIETVLSELEKKDKDIQRMQELLDISDANNVKKDKIIDEMAKSLYDYANLEVLIKCPAEYDGRYNMDLCKMNIIDRNCLICIKDYFTKKCEGK